MFAKVEMKICNRNCQGYTGYHTLDATIEEKKVKL